MALLNVPGVRDINLEQSIVGPVAGATVTSPTIDTGTTTPGDAPRAFLAFYAPAVPTLGNGKNLTFAWYDSADGVTFALLANAAPFLVTGPASGGSLKIEQPATNLPRGTRRYLRYTIVADAASGDASGVTFRGGVLVG